MTDTPKTKRRRWTMFLPLGLVLLLAAGWSAYWFIAMGFIRNEVVKAEEQAKRDGVTLGCTDRGFGGFPFRFSFECVEPVLTIDQPGAHFTGVAGKLNLVVQAWNPRHAIALLEGPTRIRDGATGLEQEVRHGLARASLRVTGDLMGELIVEVPGLDVSGKLTAEKVIVSARSLDGLTAEAAARLAVAAVLLPDGRRSEFDYMELDAEAPMGLIRAGDPLRSSAQSGEGVTIKRLGAGKDGVTLSAKGTLAVDPQGYPTGTITAEASDLDKLFAMLAAQGLISEKDAQQAREMAVLLNGGKAENATMTFAAKDGALYWGFVKLADLERVI